MSDADKAKWFDEMVNWMESNGGYDSVMSMSEDCADCAYDVFFAFMEEAKKIEDSKKE